MSSSCICEPNAPGRRGFTDFLKDRCGRHGFARIRTCRLGRGDLLGDGKWPDYLDHCDRFYWGVPPGLDRGPLEGLDYQPDCCGIIVADGYDGEILRPAPLRPLAAARRKVEVERLARAAMRTTVAYDPHCAPWGGGD